jgi:membrane-associated phospholipid phosphatase
MPDHTPLSAETASRSYQLAQQLSQLFHPILMNITTFLLVGLLAVEPRSTGLLWSFVCIALQVVPATVFFEVRRRQGAYTDADVSVRQQRNELYVMANVVLIISLVLLVWFGAPPPFLAITAAALVIGVLSGLINLRWKISGHAASIGTTAAVATLHAPLLGVAFWVCAALVGWARVKTRNHTPLQVVAGLSLAAAAVTVAFRLVVY